MPPTTAATGTPVLLQHSSGGQLTLQSAAHLPAVYASHFQPVHVMNPCLQSQGGPIQVPDGWAAAYVPFGAQHGATALMVHPMPGPQLQLQHGPPSIESPAHGHINQQPAMTSCSPTNNQFFNPLTNSTNMEVVWHGVFDQLFAYFQPHSWTLIPASTIPTDVSYKIFHDSAKVRFLCQTCGKAWTSMKGRVIFLFHLDRSSSQGVVFFKLFGQQCQKCTPGSFEHAMWYPEEVQKVVTNVYHSVGKQYYGLIQTPVYRERRKGKPRTQHNSSLCQACADNICLEGSFERSVNLGP